MTTRKARPSLFYINSRSSSWVRTLASVIDEGMAVLCMQRWQRAPIPMVQKPNPLTTARRCR
jgi:hypothetical protein